MYFTIVTNVSMAHVRRITWKCIIISTYFNHVKDEGPHVLKVNFSTRATTTLAIFLK